MRQRLRSVGLARTNLISLEGARKGGKDEVLELLRRVIQEIESGAMINPEMAVCVIQCGIPEEPDDCLYKVRTSGMILSQQFWLLEMGKQYTIKG